VKAALKGFDQTSLNLLRQSIIRGDFDRIVLTGMGGSLFASYPIWLQLINTGLPAYWVDCAELIHYAQPILTRRTLVWITSQSGRSAEVVAAHDLLHKTGATIMATVNDLNSPLAHTAQYIVPIHAQVEKTVSTRTYVNMLAVSQLAALALTNAAVNVISVAHSDEAQSEAQLRMSRAIGIGLPLAEIVLIQMLTIRLALEKGMEPGKFSGLGKLHYRNKDQSKNYMRCQMGEIPTL
jgi:glucosamine 6-phosphate synthetase-like amidotransferase/phosphosugar isomerase protein